MKKVCGFVIHKDTTMEFFGVEGDCVYKLGLESSSLNYKIRMKCKECGFSKVYSHNHVGYHKIECKKCKGVSNGN